MRIIYLSIFFIIVASVAGLYLKSKLDVPPTCYDGKQNQGETAIDLGGPCHYLNPDDLRQLSVMWYRTFEVIPGLYSAMAYVDNSNSNAGIKELGYTFRLYDEKNILIAEKDGTMFVPPSSVIPFFVSNLNTGLLKPARVLFNFKKPIVWERMDNSLAKDISIKDKKFKLLDGLPRLNATVHNKGVNDLRNIVLFATLFDNQGNAIGSSKTIIKQLKSDEKKVATFTWPESFGVFVAKIDIIPILMPQ